jgi:hypothetical protein
MQAGDWLRLGIPEGWLDIPICYVHDAPRLTDEEAALVEANDGDMDVICVTIARINI